MMFKSILLVAILLSSVSTSASMPSELQNDHLLKITSLTIYEVEPIVPIVDLPAARNSVDDVIATIDGMLAIGQKIWKIVDAGRPVITTKFSPSISVLPQLTGENPTLNQMANWSPPSYRSYRISFGNKYREVVGFTYTVYFQYGGSLKGQGKYIANLKVDASKIYTAWLYDFDASSELVGVANVGTDAAPVASAIMQISYAVRGPLNEVRDSVRFYVDGLGNIQTIP